MSNTLDKIPAWLMITIFFAIVTVLAIFTDLFTFIVGTLIMIGIFAAGYNERNSHH